MSRPVTWRPGLTLIGCALMAGLAGCRAESAGVSDEPKASDQRGRTETYTVDVTDYSAPKSPWDALLSDDRLEDKATRFDPKLVSPQAIEGYRLNLSDAVIRLDVPILKPDQDRMLLTLHPTYAAAVAHARKHFASFESPLASVNLIDGLAKQFDDGMYAALDQAYYKGAAGALESHVDLVKRIHALLPGGSDAAAFVAAGLGLAGERVEGWDSAAAGRYLAAFEGNAVLSKPIGFYTWNDDLAACFRFLRFFQRPFGARDRVAIAMGAAISSDAAVRDDYQGANRFYARLTNPLGRGTMVDASAEAPETLEVALFPASSSREGTLFLKLFPDGLPPDADLMREFVTRIRSGEIDLTPAENSGWYDHQVHALETMLLPERGGESNKLLLTKGYKRRMLEAFEALMTKRRETHVRQLDIPLSAAAVPMKELKVAPPLRIEPAATYYLRTARAYGFVGDFLEATLGSAALEALHGLTKDGERSKTLRADLEEMRDLFYGFYLTACEDIGLEPGLRDGERGSADRGLALARQWLGGELTSHADLAIDTRVAVPIYYDPNRNVTRLWVTLGVRLARLDASFARGPRVAPEGAEGDWTELKGDQLESKSFLVPVDEFVEIEVPGATVLTREELRAICDEQKTKAAIIKAISAR